MLMHLIPVELKWAGKETSQEDGGCWLDPFVVNVSKGDSLATSCCR